MIRMGDISLLFDGYKMATQSKSLGFFKIILTWSKLKLLSLKFIEKQCYLLINLVVVVIILHPQIYNNKSIFWNVKHDWHTTRLFELGTFLLR